MTTATTNWRQRVRESANRAGLPRFWRWWTGELAPLLPGVSRTALQRRFTRPVIELANGEAVFWRPEIANGAARLAVAETVTLTGDPAAVLGAGRAAVGRLASYASAGIAAPKVIVALNAQQILRKELSLPAAVEENLAQALAYDLDRHTPFRPEQLYFDATVVGRDAAKKMLRVDWVAALKTVVDGATKQVEEWGAVPVAVVPGPPAATPTRLNLLPHAARPRPLQWRRWQVWVPLAVIATFASAAVLVPLVQKRQFAIALAALNADAEQQAQAADKLRAQLEGMQNEYNYILAKKYAYPSAVHVLDEVTRVLPDDTWITQLELKTSGRAKEMQHDVYLRGESGNAGRLIALLEDSKLVEQVAPRSPTTKIQGSSGEIFDLGARLRKVPPPAPQALSLGAAPIVAAPVAPASVAPVPVAASPEATPPPAAAPAAASAAAPAEAARRTPPDAPRFGPFPPGVPVPPSAMPPRAARGGLMARPAPPPAAPPPIAQPLAAQPLVAQPLAAQPLAAQPLAAQPPAAQRSAQPVPAAQTEPAAAMPPASASPEAPPAPGAEPKADDD
jgi:general secretion pathway protein L